MLDAPLDTCWKQTFPVSAAELDALIPTAGEWVRVSVQPAGEHASVMCYYAHKKQDNDPFEDTIRVWSHFSAWLGALIFDVWVTHQ